MMRVEIGIKMERLGEIIVRYPNRLEDIRDLCLELATDIDQYLQEVEEGAFDSEYSDGIEDEEEEEYDEEEDERLQEYRYRYGDEDDQY